MKPNEYGVYFNGDGDRMKPLITLMNTDLRGIHKSIICVILLNPRYPRLKKEYVNRAIRAVTVRVVGKGE